jgi:hypothetical protein
MALVGGVVSVQAARTSVKALTVRPRRMIVEVPMGGSLPEPDSARDKKK